MASDDITYDLKMDIEHREDSEVYIDLFRKEYPNVPSSDFIEECKRIKCTMIDKVMGFSALPLGAFLFFKLLSSSFLVSLNAASSGAAALVVMLVMIALLAWFPLTYAFLHRNDHRLMSELAGPFRLACEKENLPKQHYEKFIASVTEPPVPRPHLPGGCSGSGSASASCGGC